MKRLHILLIILVLVLGAAGWYIVNQPKDIPSLLVPEVVAPDEEILGTLSGGMDTDTLSGDDTELPLDQRDSDQPEEINRGEDADTFDPEVEEIINLLEQLIAESETN